MNKTALNLIAKALRERSREVRANKTWQLLHEQENIGTPCAGGFRLDSHDYNHLQTIYARYSKQQAEVGGLAADADRMDAAEHFRNEKVVRDVFARELIFAAPQTPLLLLSGEVPAGLADVLLALPLRALDVAAVVQVIVVENGTMLTRWRDWLPLLPQAWQSALLLYRGHGENVRHVDELVQRLPNDAALAVYPDFDLAGLGIAAHYARLRPASLVLPRDWAQFTRTHPANREDVFAKQSARETPLFDGLLQTLAEHIQRERLAVMQENCLQTGALAVQGML